MQASRHVPQGGWAALKACIRLRQQQVFSRIEEVRDAQMAEEVQAVRVLAFSPIYSKLLCHCVAVSPSLPMCLVLPGVSKSS